MFAVQWWLEWLAQPSHFFGCRSAATSQIARDCTNATCIAPRCILHLIFVWFLHTIYIYIEGENLDIISHIWNILSDSRGKCNHLAIAMPSYAVPQDIFVDWADASEVRRSKSLRSTCGSCAPSTVARRTPSLTRPFAACWGGKGSKLPNSKHPDSGNEAQGWLIYADSWHAEMVGQLADQWFSGCK